MPKILVMSFCSVSVKSLSPPCICSITAERGVTHPRDMRKAHAHVWGVRPLQPVKCVCVVTIGNSNLVKLPFVNGFFCHPQHLHCFLGGLWWETQDPVVQTFCVQILQGKLQGGPRLIHNGQILVAGNDFGILSHHQGESHLQPNIVPTKTQFLGRRCPAVSHPNFVAVLGLVSRVNEPKVSLDGLTHEACCLAHF